MAVTFTPLHLHSVECWGLSFCRDLSSIIVEIRHLVGRHCGVAIFSVFVLVAAYFLVLQQVQSCSGCSLSMVVQGGYINEKCQSKIYARKFSLYFHTC